MRFNILDYLDTLEIISRNSSYIEAKCPLCGYPNFKISLSPSTRGAYRCWTNECSNSAIRQHLSPAVISPFKIPPKAPSPFRPSRPSYIKPLELPELSLAIREIPIETNIVSNTNSTIYYYSSEKRVTRFTSSIGKKIFYPEYLRADKWYTGLGNEVWPFYNLEELLLNINKSHSGALMVEGEKCVNYCRYKLNIPAITSQGSSWNLDKLRVNFFRLSSKITHLLYIYDNDEVGYKKANLVYQASTLEDIPCKVLPATLFGDLPIAGDLADLNLNKSTFLQTCLTNYHVHRNGEIAEGREV